MFSNQTFAYAGYDEFSFSILAVCHDLVDPGNGRLVIMTGNEIGDTAAYICNFGYKLVGAVNLTCQDDGTWSDPPPVCKSVGMRKTILLLYLSVVLHNNNTAVTKMLKPPLTELLHRT